MVKENLMPGIDEKMTQQQYEIREEKEIITESEAIQEELVSNLSALAKIYMKYEWKPTLKIIFSVILMFLIYILVGWDAVASGVTLFTLMVVMLYIFQSKHQEKEYTTYVECKQRGQKIVDGDHNPYGKEFYVMEKRFAVWLVPNVLIKRGLFKNPATQDKTSMPGSSEVIYCDFFDRLNRTCVMPVDMDVANIAFETNMNPSLAEKFDNQAEQIKKDKKLEEFIRSEFSMGRLKAKEAKAMLEPIKIRYRSLSNPKGEIRRDVLFDLQNTIPTLREQNQFLRNKMFLLADYIAAEAVYQMINIPMPQNIREDHEFLRKNIYGLPPKSQFRKK